MTLEAYRQATFSTCSLATWDTMLYMFAGTMTSSSSCSSADDSCSAQSSITMSSSSVARTVQVWVTGYSTNTGTVRMSITCSYSEYSI